MINPYEFLGLTKSECSLAELKTAYYRLALICHPDKGGEPGSMMTLTLAYKWIHDQLLAANHHQKEFTEYYGDALKNGDVDGDGTPASSLPIPSFTDVLAETFDYTPERFQVHCECYAITSKDIQKMLFIPAFEWAMAKKATPDTLSGLLYTFLESYVRDTQTPLDSVEYYVPMTAPNGYGERMTTEDSEFIKHKESYLQPIASNMILYQEPVTLDVPIQASIHTDTSQRGFTNIAAPLPTYDYEEAFTTYVIPDADADASYENDVMDALNKKELERQLQDQTL